VDEGLIFRGVTSFYFCKSWNEVSDQEKFKCFWLTMKKRSIRKIF